MNRIWYEHRVQLVGVIVVVLLVGSWALVPHANADPPIVSGWSGDGGAAAPVVPQGAAAPPPQAATAPDAAARAGHPADVPWGNPLGTAPTVMTQGYGVGSHAPAAVWGGVDLAVDSDGDGRSNPEATMGTPLYATMGGVVTLNPNSVPAGNHLWIKNEHYKVGYAHMSGYAVKNGQTVQPGDLIGYAGASGQVTGPHLHYHIWKDGVNVNPLEYGALPGASK